FEAPRFARIARPACFGRLARLGLGGIDPLELAAVFAADLHRLAPAGALIVPLGLRPVVRLAVGLGEAPGPSVLLAQLEPAEVGTAAQAGREADRGEQQHAGLP